jgi:hypothetical protein
MIRLFPARRRAERFDSLVEGDPLVRGGRDDVDRATSELLELVGALRSTPEQHARPEFVADLRERLMLAAATELKAAAGAARERDEVARLTVKPGRTRREHRVGIALGAVAIIGATGSMAVASQGAIPGDPLYPVKRAIESTETGFSVGDDSKGQTILGNASGRLDEVGELTGRSKPDAALITSTLNTFSDQATQAGDLLMSDYEQTGHRASIQRLQTFTAASMGTLSELEPAVPAAAHDALAHAAEVVLAIDSAADNVCPDCGEPLTELPPQLASGPLSAPDEATDTSAGGELPGAGQPSQSPPPTRHHGGKGNLGTSGLNPPETPITLPTELPTTPSDAASDPGDVHPSAGGTAGGTGGNQSGNQSGGQNGGKGGKGGPSAPASNPVDLSPVTGAVGDVVTGVVEGVTGVVTGLTGGLLGALLGTPTPGADGN